METNRTSSLLLALLVVVAVATGFASAASRQPRVNVMTAPAGTNVTVVDDTGEVVVDAPFTNVRVGPIGGSVSVPGLADVSWGGCGGGQGGGDGGRRRLVTDSFRGG